MFFPNLNATLNIEDKSYLNNIELTLLYKENPEVQNIADTQFNDLKKARFNSNGDRVVSMPLPLTKEGKLIITNIVNLLKDLDSKFEVRSHTIDEFKDLLN